jgi:hypothetical protein
MTRRGTRQQWAMLVRDREPGVIAPPPITAVCSLSRPRGMNKIERRYSEHLELRRRAGEIVWWGYESIKLRLATRTYFTPDFAVQPPIGRLEIHETKGFWREDARLKMKTAAELFPFRFVGVQDGGRGAWRFEYFGEVGPT